jgi:hypothetical protein
MSDSQQGFGLDVEFIDHLYIQLVTTSNYSTIANLHSSQITKAQAKPSQSAFTSRFLVTDFNNGDSSTSMLTSLLSGEYPTSEVCSKLCTAHNISARTNRKQQLCYCCVPVCCGPYLANGRCSQSHRLATSLYVTIHFQEIKNTLWTAQNQLILNAARVPTWSISLY